MSFFKKIFSTKEKSYEKYGDILKKVPTTKEQREEAIDVLEKLPGNLAIPQILKRFEMVLESGLQDCREKERCMSLIIGYGADAAGPFVRNYLSSKTKVSWPIKIAEKLFEPNVYRDILLENLSTDMVVFDEDILEKNVEILLALKDVKSPLVFERALEFLNSRSEMIRMAALECVDGQAGHESVVKDHILQLLKTAPTGDNTRFLGVAQEIAKKHNWF